MAQLLKYEKRLPEDFYSTKTHMWIVNQEGKLETSDDHETIHAQIWGEWAWDVQLRGYYNDGYGLVKSHGKMDTDLINKLAKAFPNAIFYYD